MRRMELVETEHTNAALREMIDGGAAHRAQARDDDIERFQESGRQCWHLRYAAARRDFVGRTEGAAGTTGKVCCASSYSDLGRSLLTMPLARA